MSYVTATYQIYDPKGQLEKKAEGIALGLTVGSWTNLPSLEQEQLKAHKGYVERVEELPSDEKYGKKGLVTITYPSANFSADLPAVLTTTFGKLSLDGKVKLIDLDFSHDLKTYFPGPKYGIEGVREIVGVQNR
ncbi:2,3-diketo-5-methylthiopentyl-1-phosphate enolase, partial [Alkalihalobacillus alcalophilus ATCC 27647 = CGMCC 1.3604]